METISIESAVARIPFGFMAVGTLERVVDEIVRQRKRDLTMIGLRERRATLLETAPGVSVEAVVAATEANLDLAESVAEMSL